MKIFVVSPFLPYPGVPHAGGKLVYFLLDCLVRRHSVFLLSRCFSGEERNVSFLREKVAGIEVIRAEGPLQAGDPLSFCRTVSSYIHLARRAKEISRRNAFEVCQVEFTETGVLWTPPDHIPSVLTCHDIIAKPPFRRYAASRGASKVGAWARWMVNWATERHSVSKFQRVLTLSEEDREWGMRLYPGVSFDVLKYPGGVDFAELPRREVPNRILFVGALNRPPNIEAVKYFWQRVWPAVRAKVPEAEFWVVGGGLPTVLKEALSRDERIRITGTVERVEEFYKSAAVFVAPILEGGGIIVKILDAMAAGVAVVTTPYGNEGIRAKAGEEILVADSPDIFADSVTRLLKDARLRTAVGCAGKQFVERSFSAKGFLATIDKVYQEIGAS